MTAAPRSPTSGASRAGPPDAPAILCVGDDAWASRLRREVQAVLPRATLRRVGGYLHALGELSSDQPDIVIGRLHETSDGLEPTASALRELAPRARLVLVAARAEEPDARRALAAGFDGYVLEPYEAGELGHALAQPPSNGDGPPRGNGAALVAPRVNEATAAPPVHSPVAEPPPPPIADADLGDIDLIEQTLQDPSKLRGIAVRLLASRSGVAGVAWAETADESPAGHARVAVEHRGHRFGALHAPPPAAAAQLAPWAVWLGHWLAMAAKVQELSAAALRDDLTGLWNRRYFREFLRSVVSRAARDRFRVTLMLFDIDDFKSYNDRFGHAAGDAILREAGRLMQSVVRTHDVVARIGGDEFAVIFWDAEGPRRPRSEHPQDVRKAAERFRKAINDHRFPKLLDEAPGKLTISGGLAGFPWDGRSPEELMALADQRAMQSKKQGKNAITFGPGAEAESGSMHV